jgi:hypothetical protein
VADRLEPLRPPAPPRSPALLIRFGGRWWYRSEITTGEDPDVQLHP